MRLTCVSEVRDADHLSLRLGMRITNILEVIGVNYLCSGGRG